MDKTELICKYVFDQFGMNTRDNHILLTEQVQNSNSNKEQISELMFEKFQFNAMQIQIQALLSTFSEGKQTSCVLESGEGVSYVIPIKDGYIIRNLIRRINIAGGAITEYLTKLLFLSGYAFNSTADYETVREMKEKLCFVR